MERVISINIKPEDTKVVFDEKVTAWSKIPEYNRIFIGCQQNHFNRKLAVTGHVFLNEVFDALGLPRTKNGAVTGWVKGNGDKIDFGAHELDSNHIELNFNIHGVIFDLI